MQIFLENSELYSKSTVHESKCSRGVLFPSSPLAPSPATLVDRWKTGSVWSGEVSEVTRVFSVSNLGSSEAPQHHGAAASSTF